MLPLACDAAVLYNGSLDFVSGCLSFSPFKAKVPESCLKGEKLYIFFTFLAASWMLVFPIENKLSEFGHASSF